jgi:hypothetical protein
VFGKHIAFVLQVDEELLASVVLICKKLDEVPINTEEGP